MKEQSITNKNNGGIQMMKKFKKQMKNEKGLTLIELLAVIVILAIVAAIAVPAIGNIIQNSREKAIISDAQMVLSAASLFFLENSTVETIEITKESNVLIPDFLDDLGKLDTATVTKSSEKGGNKIKFTGKAGKKTISMKDMNKADLSKEDLVIEYAGATEPEG